MPTLFAAAEVIFGDLVLFVGDGGVAYDVDVEVILAVSLLDDVQDGLDILQGLVEFSGYGEAHDGGLTVGGDGLLSLGELFGGEEG